MADDARLDLHRILESTDAVVPARFGIGDHFRLRARQRAALVARVERLLDVADIESDPLRLDRKSDVYGERESVRVALGGRRIITKKTLTADVRRPTQPSDLHNT